MNKKTKSECAGGNERCGNCKINPNSISPEEIMKGLSIRIDPRAGSVCSACNECLGK